MAYDNNQNGDRQMYQGDWKCGGCGGSIKELPFEPDASRANQLRCRDCFKKSKQSNGGGGGGDKQMYEGNWKCSKCDKDINKLPFNPDPSRADQLQCIDCHRNNQAPRRRF